MLTQESFRFAKQAGAIHIVAHLANCFNNPDSPSTASRQEFAVTANQDRLRMIEGLNDLHQAVKAEGLELAAIENFDPSHWYDVLLGGPIESFESNLHHANLMVLCCRTISNEQLSS